MYILTINNLCTSLSPILSMIGNLLNLFKVMLPLILICLGIFDIGKAVISSKTDDVKKNLKNFAIKIAISILVFFVPTICMVVFNFIGGFEDIKNDSGIDFDVCYSCMFFPNNDDCQDALILMKE